MRYFNLFIATEVLLTYLIILHPNSLNSVPETIPDWPWKQNIPIPVCAGASFRGYIYIYIYIRVTNKKNTVITFYYNR